MSESLRNEALWIMGYLAVAALASLISMVIDKWIEGDGPGIEALKFLVPMAKGIVKALG